MATLREYFDTDFQNILNVGNTLTTSNATEKIDILTRVHQDFDSNTKYLSFFIPETKDCLNVLVGLVNILDKILAISEGVEVLSGLPGEKLVNSKDLQFSGKIFVYSETDIPEDKLEALQNELRQKNIYLQYRGPRFAIKRSEIEKPLAFISHDSRDKDDIARPIAIGLSKLMCPVWFDEYSLKVGDNLRESIEKGIKECKNCILILSPNFLANNGWTKVEFNSIFTRELIEDTDVVLPVWHGIDKKELYEYSPSLVNKVGVKTDVGTEEVIRKLYQSIRH
jgi:hypothetical protein